MTSGIDVQASVAADLARGVDVRQVEAVVRHVLMEEGVATAEISIALVGDEEIAGMNRDYLAHEGATDVISFALQGSGEDPLGDIYIGVAQAERQASELGVPVDEEFLRLAVHGTLHVLGYDHPVGAERDRSEMYLRQEALLASFLDGIRPGGS